MIFSDGEGRLNISRANNPFITTIGMLDSKDFTRHKPAFHRKNQLFIKSIERSKDSFVESSESADFDEEMLDEPVEPSHINARNIPVLQSFCKNLWKKPKQENYYKKPGSSLYSSIRGSTRASGSIGRRNPRMKESVMLGVKNSFSKPNSPGHLRRTIYIDENNNIVDGFNRLRKQSRARLSKNSINIPNVVFESNGNSQKGIWDDISLLQDKMSPSEIEYSNQQKFFGKRFKSPAIIPEQNRTLIISNKNSMNSRHHRVKSISPRNFTRGNLPVKEQSFQNFFQIERRKNTKNYKFKMKNKISRLMETFQSIPIKLKERKDTSKKMAYKSPNRININLKQ